MKTNVETFRAKVAAGQADWAMKTISSEYDTKVAGFRSKVAEGRADWAMRTISEKY